MSQEWCFLVTKGLRAVTTDGCDAMLRSLLLYPPLLRRLYFLASLPPPPPPPPLPSTHSLRVSPRGAAQNKRSLQQSFTDKLFTKPAEEAECLPDTESRPGLPGHSPPVQSSFFLYFSPSFPPQSPPSFMLTIFQW